MVGRWHRIYATPSRSICGSEKDAEIRNRKSRCVAVCMQRATTIESVLWKGQRSSGASSGSRSGCVRESEDDARGSSTQGAVAVRAHRVMI